MRITCFLLVFATAGASTGRGGHFLAKHHHARKHHRSSGADDGLDQALDGKQGDLVKWIMSNNGEPNEGFHSRRPVSPGMEFVYDKPRQVPQSASSPKKAVASEKVSPAPKASEAVLVPESKFAEYNQAKQDNGGDDVANILESEESSPPQLPDKRVVADSDDKDEEPPSPQLPDKPGAADSDDKDIDTKDDSQIATVLDSAVKEVMDGTKEQVQKVKVGEAATSNDDAGSGDTPNSSSPEAQDNIESQIAAAEQPAKEALAAAATETAAGDSAVPDSELVSEEQFAEKRLEEDQQEQRQKEQEAARVAEEQRHRREVEHEAEVKREAATKAKREAARRAKALAAKKAAEKAAAIKAAQERAEKAKREAEARRAKAAKAEAAAAAARRAAQAKKRATSEPEIEATPEEVDALDAAVQDEYKAQASEASLSKKVSGEQPAVSDPLADIAAAAVSSPTPLSVVAPNKLAYGLDNSYKGGDAGAHAPAAEVDAAEDVEESAAPKAAATAAPTKVDSSPQATKTPKSGNPLRRGSKQRNEDQETDNDDDQDEQEEKPQENNDDEGEQGEEGDNDEENSDD
mmetsp:Transcript_39213/g.94269  ORF Transcript_39213/g.94269 Transcript_39213/m.94269 type:complete len:576 (+) Transcript_39213:55-1782(+)